VTLRTGAVRDGVPRRGTRRAAGIETLTDTGVREHLHAALEQPLADAGLDAEYVVLASLTRVLPRVMDGIAGADAG
jgi:hypothetical protein